MNVRRPLVIAVALALGAVGNARADEVSDLKAQMEAMQKQMDALKGRLEQVTKQVEAQKEAQQQQEAKNKQFLQMTPGSGLTFLTPGGGDVTLYGNLDVSVDTTTKGLKSSYEDGGQPVGAMGWMGAISTNLSYVGVRGRHPFDPNFNLIWQLEAGIDISATPGTKASNSNTSDAVTGALFSRNSFIGFSGADWGAVMVGKSETPYKLSTDRLNPFSGMIGDYRVIMGNTGGDNRVEFAYRAPHAIWYNSPTWNGLALNVLYSPGQNRSSSGTDLGANNNLASAESDCAGGNIPGSGALPPSCNDGSFGNLTSVAGTFTYGPLYVTAAYEQHNAVNRSSDTIGFPTTPPEDTQGDPNDVANETAWKVAAQYALPTKTTIGYIYEKFHRNVPAYLEYQNERQRWGSWLVVTQALTEKDVLSGGWAHAAATPGDPGQHNTPGGSNPDNAANMYTVAWKHMLDRSTTIYADWAMTVNHADAHYDLGAGGHGVTTDCHDASQQAAFDPTANGGAGGVTGNGPHCFAGGRLQGFSVGVNYRF
ncbi:MAG TPA: porin [Casimicrobiaceae bacterium]|nr:porin [Casimicrobiaceae bacterium]